MKAVTIAIVVAGVTLALAMGFSQGFDGTSVSIFVAIALVGGLAIAAANRFTSGATSPATCEECGGVISPNAPFCKHCGARRAS